ncbi:MULTISPECIES: hypothetical protein [unclassified Lentilitoribacter]|jgi:hypothetical protein|uniref:hypothetical protein n=1 Tax=unclassified Lentilitoribacter TaxID=2647570 RepID=UPI0013A70778|nr:hypothetical protein [Lentilitoribacter sp. Alg239-R112]
MLQLAGGILIASAVIWLVLKVIKNPTMFLSGIIKTAIVVLVAITIYMISRSL